MCIRDRVGIFIFTGIAFLTWLILSLGELGSRFQKVYAIEVRFSDASGIIKGTAVKLAGAHIGSVSESPVLESGLNPQALVPLEIEATRQLPANTIFQIRSASVLGDKIIIATIPETPASELLVAGSRLNGGQASGLDALQSDAEAVARDARLLMTDTRDSLAQFDTTLQDIQSLASELTHSSQKLNTNLLSDQNLTSLSRIIANVEDTSVGTRNAAIDIKPLLLNAQETLLEFKQLAQRAEKTFDEIDAQLAHVGPAMEQVPETMQTLNQVAHQTGDAVGEAEKTFAKASQTLDTINEGTGLVGTLTKDDEVSTDTKTFIRNLRRHGILGYRDEETDEDDPRERFTGRRR